MDCIFCKIAAGEIPSEKVYEDESIYAFKDIKPAAPVHILVIPKKHIGSLAEVKEEDVELLGKIQLTISRIAAEHGLSSDGYRVITNIGEHGKQSVKHLHYHIVGGRELSLNIV